MLPLSDRTESHVMAAGQQVVTFGFPIDQAGDVQITRQAGAAAPVVLALSADYTLQLIAGGFQIGLVAAASLNDVIAATGEMPINRTADFGDGKRFDQDNLNAEFDRVTRINQETRRDIKLLLANLGLAQPVEFSVQTGVPAWRRVGATAWNLLVGLAVAAHNHIIGDVTGLQAALDGKAALAHAHADAGAADGFMSATDKSNLDALVAIPRLRASLSMSQVSVAGTYVRAGAVITVTSAGHGLQAAATGKFVYFQATTGTGTSGYYAAVTYIDANNFSIVDPTTSGATAGNCNLLLRGFYSYNIASVVINANGNFTVAFAANIPPAYAASGTAVGTRNAAAAASAWIVAIFSKTQAQCQVMVVDNSSDALFIPDDMNLSIFA